MKIEKIEKLITNLHDKTESVIHIKNLKKALSHGLVSKKVHGVISFNQKGQLKPYIDINTELRKGAKNGFEKDFFKLMNNSVFGKTMEDFRKQRDLNLQQQKGEENYHTAKFLTENFLGIEMRKTQIFMNKPVYLSLSILDLSKTVMYEF